ncbi:hypothetical protein GCM10009642_27530 [Nocardiopsis metallicus]
MRAVGQGVEGVQGAAQRQRREEAVLAGVRALVHDLSSPVVVLRARGWDWCVVGPCGCCFGFEGCAPSLGVVRVRVVFD